MLVRSIKHWVMLIYVYVIYVISEVAVPKAVYGNSYSIFTTSQTAFLINKVTQYSKCHTSKC